MVRLDGCLNDPTPYKKSKNNKLAWPRWFTCFSFFLYRWHE
jgi:hypothetical protein